MSSSINKVSKKEKRELLESVNAYKWLTMSQLFKLMWWEWTSSKRIGIFYNSLKMGKAAIFAYRDARDYGKKS